MKIIHCADVHLDSPMESKLSKEKSKQRKRELLENFKNMVDFAAKNDVEVILIAGDLFDNTKKIINKKTKRYIIDLIKSNEQIDFIYLKGNHDGNNFLEEEDMPQNLKMFNNDWNSYSYGNVVITGVELDKNNKNIFKTLNLKYENFNIVTMHGQIDKSLNRKDKGEIIYLNELKNKNIDYLALGHIHKGEEGNLDSRGIYVYPGCLEGRSFDECGEKGFILLEIENGNLKRSFIKNSKRTVYEIEVNIVGINSQLELDDLIEKKLINIYKENIVRVTLVGDYEVKEIGEGLETYLEIDKIQSKYENEFFYFEVKNEAKPIINWEKFQNDISLKGEFIRLVKEQNWSEDEKNEVCLSRYKGDIWR
ncbi:MAG: metallophosphoesterase [Clostridia bacterium]|nr:metallophosphoesterase [Clostridia bacterium]